MWDLKRSANKLTLQVIKDTSSIVWEVLTSSNLNCTVFIRKTGYVLYTRRCEGICEGMCEGRCEGMCTVYTRYSSMNLDLLRYIFACRKIRTYLIFFTGMITRTLHQTAAILQNILQKKMTKFHNDCIFAINNSIICIFLFRLESDIFDAEIVFYSESLP